MTELNITDCPLKGKALRQEIVDRVKATQSVIIRTLPDLLILTKEQYKDLEHDPQMIDMHQSKERIYATQYNVMELSIKD
jgi:hypothetical protein